jgi:DNA-binding MarR family transcriptional regulator
MAKRSVSTAARTTGRAPLQLESFLCHAIYMAGHAFSRVYQPLLRRLGLTYPQYLAMVALWEQDGLTVGSLGEKLMLESSTLTPLLKRLETMGHLKRNRDPADERQVLISLTAQGRKLRQQAIDIPGCIVEASGTSAENLGELQRRIAELTSALLSHSTEAKPLPRKLASG